MAAMTGAIDAYRHAANAYSRALNARESGRDEIGIGETDASSGGATSGPSFAEMVRTSLDQTIQQQRTAETQAANAVSGHGDLSAVVTSVAEAEVALQAVVAIRDKVVEAYKDILRMQI